MTEENLINRKLRESMLKSLSEEKEKEKSIKTLKLRAYQEINAKNFEI